MSTNAKNPLLKVGEFFKAIGKGYAKIPFILKVFTGLVIGVILALLLPNATFI